MIKDGDRPIAVIHKVRLTVTHNNDTRYDSYEAGSAGACPDKPFVTLPDQLVLMVLRERMVRMEQKEQIASGLPTFVVFLGAPA